MKTIRIIFQFIFSLAFAVACWLALSPFFAAVLKNSDSIFEKLSYLAAAFVALAAGCDSAQCSVERIGGALPRVAVAYLRTRRHAARARRSAGRRSPAS